MGLRWAAAADSPRQRLRLKEIPMSQKNRRSNREAKKPKQNKAKVVVSTSPFASANSKPDKTSAAKRK
jgi:hypothetical protein